MYKLIVSNFQIMYFCILEIMSLVSDMHTCASHIIQHLSSKPSSTPADSLSANPAKLCFVVRQSIREAAVGKQDLILTMTMACYHFIFISASKHGPNEKANHTCKTKEIFKNTSLNKRDFVNNNFSCKCSTYQFLYLCCCSSVLPGTFQQVSE